MLLLSYTQETTNYVPSEHLFGVDRKHLFLRRGAIISGLKKILHILLLLLLLLFESQLNATF